MQVDSYTETDFKDTEIGPIPTEWEYLPLGNLLVLLRNGLNKAQNLESGDYPVTRIQTISDDRINLDKVGYVNDLTEDEIDRFELRRGDILFSHINSEPQLGRTVVFEGNPPLLLHGMNLLRLQVDTERLDPYLLHYLMMHYRELRVFIRIASRSVNQSSINQTKLGALQIPLPPLPEQRRIAAVLNAIQDEIAAQDDIISAAREFKRSLMQRLFTYGPGSEPAETKETEIGEIPAHWEVKPLNTISEFTRKPKHWSLDSGVTGVPFIPMEIVPEDSVFITHAEVRTELKSGTYCENGDLLISKITPSFENGKQGIIALTGNAVHLYATTEVFPIRGKEDLATNLFLFYFFKLSNVRSELAGRMEGTTGRKRVPKAVLEEYGISTPPTIEEQNTITDRLQLIDAKIAVEEDRKAALQDFFKSILHQLMTGQIRSTDSQEFK